MEQRWDGPLGEVIVQALSMGDLLRCPCPMCREARENGAGE